MTVHFYLDRLLTENIPPSVLKGYVLKDTSTELIQSAKINNIWTIILYSKDRILSVEIKDRLYSEQARNTIIVY